MVSLVKHAPHGDEFEDEDVGGGPEAQFREVRRGQLLAHALHRALPRVALRQPHGHKVHCATSGPSDHRAEESKCYQS
jgi:hypothetical protein